MIGTAEERIDQKLQDIRNVVAGTVLADLSHEPLLMLVHCRIGVRPVPRQHLHGVAAHGADLLHAPVGNRARLAAAGRLLHAVLFQRHDQAAAWRQQIDRGGHCEIWVEQHRAAMRSEVLDQEALCRRDVGIFDLVPRDAFAFAIASNNGGR